MANPDQPLEQLREEMKKMFSQFGTNGSGGGGSANSGGTKGGEFSFRSQMLIILGVVAVFAAFSSFYKVEPSEQGVVTRFGAFSHVVSAGPHWKIPFGVEQVYKVPVTRINELQFGFRKRGSLSNEQAEQESLMLTGDLNVAVAEWILQYKVADAKKFLFRSQDVERTIRDVTISVMRRVVGDKLVSDVLTTDRVVIGITAQEIIQELLDYYDVGVAIVKVALQNVTPPERVRAAFNDVNVARQEQEQRINQAKGTYNKVIPEAEGKAARLIAEAEAFGIDVINRAKGDSSRFKSILKAYKNSPQVTRDRMYLETMEEIFGNVSQLTIVDAKIKGLLPIFNDIKNRAATPANSTLTGGNS